MKAKIILWSVTVGVLLFIMASTRLLQFIVLPANLGTVFLLRGASWHGLSSWLFLSVGILVQAAIFALVGFVISLVYGKYSRKQS